MTGRTTLSASALDRIKLIVEVGSFVLTKYPESLVSVSDGSSIVDGLIKQFITSRFDNAAVADQLSIGISRGLSDAGVVSDDEKLSLFKSIVDGVGVIELHAKFVSKTSSDGSSVSESKTISTNKGVFDPGFASDQKTFDVSKYLSDNFAVLESLALSLSTPASDGALFVDSEARNFVKFVSDSVSVTDDIDGEASVEDDQEIQFFKNITNVAAAIDDFVRVVSYVREFTDEAFVTDSSTLSIDKASQSGLGVVDQPFFEAEKVALDGAQLADVYSSDLSKPIFDEYAVTDVAAWTLSVSFEDGISVSESSRIDRARFLASAIAAAQDIVYVDVNKAFSEQPTIVDLNVFSFGKSISDVAGASDTRSFAVSRPAADSAIIVDARSNSFAKSVSDPSYASDSKILLTQKFLSDQFSVTDLIVLLRTINKQFSESPLVSDAGALRSQGYTVDFTYFAEDYVGSSRTF